MDEWVNRLMDGVDGRLLEGVGGRWVNETHLFT